jgi:hypothetical protein
MSNVISIFVLTYGDGGKSPIGRRMPKRMRAGRKVGTVRSVARHTYHLLRPVSRPSRMVVSTAMNRRFAAIYLVSIAALTCSCNPGVESFYPSLGDARSQGAIDRGWIPDYLPDSSRSIHEMHRIEHPTTWCAFDFSAHNANSLESKLRGHEISRADLSSFEIQSPSTGWWPDFLVGHLNLDKVQANSFHMYSVRDSARIPASPERQYLYVFAVNWAAGRGYFHQTTVKM